MPRLPMVSSGGSDDDEDDEADDGGGGDDLSRCQVAALLPLCRLSHAAPSASVQPAMEVDGCLF